jgi:hypothetical protein
MLSTNHSINPRLNRLNPLPKKRLWRTNNLAKTLREQGKAFQWFTKNSITFDIPVMAPLRKKSVFITGSLTCYKVRVDTWSFITGGSFSYREFEFTNGNALLWNLVYEDILPNDYLPKTSYINFTEAHGGVSFDELPR